MTRITEVEIRDVLGIKYVKIHPTGSMTLVGGENEQGKTSLLDSICMILGGAKLCPARPIRNGKDYAEASLILDADESRQLPRMRVTRKWVKCDDGSIKTDLEIIDADDESEDDDPMFEPQRAAAPQTLLNDLINRVSFDPLSIARMDAKTRVANLMDAIGVDFTEIDELIAGLYNHRRDVARDLKVIEGQLASAPAMVEGLPENPIDVRELAEELSRINSHNSKMEVKAGEIRSMRKSLADAVERIDALKRDLLKAEERYKDLTDRLAEAEPDIKETEDDAPIREQLADADKLNKQIASNSSRKKIIETFRKAKSIVEAATAELEAARKKKQDMIHGIEWPVEGMSIDESLHDLTVDGVPFGQLSSARKAIVSTALGLESNPGLPIMIIREGSLLDDKLLVELATMAAKKNGQLFVERVGEGRECHVIMRDGEVYEPKEEAVDVPAAQS